MLKGLVDFTLRIGRPCTFYLRDRMEYRDLEWLLSQRYLESVVLETENPDLGYAFPERVGYHSPDDGGWQMPLKIAKDMVYVGPFADFGVRAACRAWHAGIRRVHVVSNVRRDEVYSLSYVIIRKALSSLLYRVWVGPVQQRIEKRVLSLFLVQELLFSRRLQTIQGAVTRCSLAPSDWVPNRIIMVGGTLGPGGAERQLTATLTGLFARGHTDLLLLHHSPMEKPNDFFLPKLIKAGVPFAQVDRNFLSIKRTSPEFEAELEKLLVPLGDLSETIAPYLREFYLRRPEIVHIWLDDMNVIAGLAALLAGVPRIILSCRSLSPTHFALNKHYMRPAYRLLAKFPNVTFLNNSDAGAADYSRWLGIERVSIRVVRNGFDFSGLPPLRELLKLRNEYRRFLGIPIDAPVVGVIMRVAEEKRPFLWIEIARRIAKKSSDSNFLMVGNGALCEQVKSVALSALPGKIFFPGYEVNVAMAIASMDVFLLTSRAEGLPNVLIEAQAIGVPPVAIDVGGVSETMVDGKTGVLLKTSNADVAAEKVVDLLSDRDAYRITSFKAREFVRSSFDVNRMIDQTLSVYRLMETSEEHNAL
jgi:glycosyltransferase involved in cell wall biosynthesis